jgi:putative membrane protein
VSGGPGAGAPRADAAAPPPGAQPERTALAWRRTSLSVAVGSLVAGRVLEPWFGPAVWVLAVAGLVVAVALDRGGARRAALWAQVVDDAHPERGPGAPMRARTPGGAALGATAVATAALGVAALAAVLRHAGG